jgi:L-lysine exporter family protein LysE/ArgO
MTSYFVQGLLLGLAYVAPIGIQNLYVINSALRGNFWNSIKVALITIFFDISLALACFFGIGLLIDNFVIAKAILLFAGSIAVLIIGYKLIISKPEISTEVTTSLSLKKIIVSCFVVTWFNPQAIIDGSLLLGGYRAGLPVSGANSFIVGVTSASFLWFTSLAVATSLFKKVFNEKILRIINIVCGLIVVFYGFKLGYSFFELLGKYLR